jgi:hypothetical protein
MNESDDSKLINELIVEGEGQTVDFKKVEILSDSIKLAKVMVAFANTTGGRILIGVCNDGTLEGMKSKKEHETYIMNVARDRCIPPLAPKFSVVRKPEGDIYVVKVLRYQKLPHAVKTREGNVYFVRVGSTVRAASPSELALLFEGAREEIISKKPELELSLVDDKGNATKEIYAQPIIVKKKIKLSRPQSPISATVAELSKQAKLLSNLGLFGTEEIPKDLVPIGIEISNVGEIPARGIRIFLKFPENCELISERDVKKGGLSYLLQPLNSTSGGLFVAREDKSEAWAWIDVLGNDLVMRRFEKVYVRFPEKEQEYKVEAHVTQYNFPPKDFKFSIIVKPKIVEEVEYVAKLLGGLICWLR